MSISVKRIGWVIVAMTVAGAVVAGTLRAEAQAVSWKAALQGPPRALTAPLDWFAKEVTAKTGGQVKKLMLDLREPALAEFAKAYRAADQKNCAEFKAKGIEIIDFPAAERAKLVASADKYWKAWAEDMQKRGLKGREILEFAQAKLKEYAKK